MSAVLKAKTHLRVPRPGGLQISYTHLKSLEFAVDRIPPKTPKRWDLISRFVMDSAIDRAEESPDVQLCERGGPSFTGTADDCKKAYELVAKSYPFTLEKSESVLEDQLCTYPEKMR